MEMQIKGKGSIQQLDKGDRYRCRHWMLQVQTDQGRKTRRVEGSVKDAKSALEDFISFLEAGGNAPTFQEYATRWLDRCEAAGVHSPNTLMKRRAVVRRVAPMLEKPLSDVTQEDIENVVIALKADGLSSTTVRTYAAVVKTVFNEAFQRGDIASDPCARVKLPKKDTQQVEAIPKAELDAMLDRLDGWRRIDGHVAAFYLMITLGLRSEEALALRWEDVGENSIIVRRALKVADMTVADTKSATSTRELPMPDRLKSFMARWREQRWDDGWVCPGRGCGLLHPVNLRRWARKNGFPTRFHQLRHSYLTELAKSGCSPYVLQRIAGWSDLKMAMVYCKVGFAEMEHAVSAVQW